MAKNQKNPLDLLALVLVVVGGLNWGVLGVANLNVVTAVLGSVPLLVQLVYVLVGLSALWLVYKEVA
ncbi:DUF378 domain-containing protein [Candidatus Micrarchaeota archaeon CG1_02_55_22]|nr:MAG: DUF378 domain-containing protein [Candidatus Micrarchaeota archaeon CG1_02_55_22]